VSPGTLMIENTPEYLLDAPILSLWEYILILGRGFPDSSYTIPST
jgi:hypothetical protein